MVPDLDPRLRAALQEALLLERVVQSRVPRLAARAAVYRNALALVREIEAVSREHELALVERLGDDDCPDSPPASDGEFEPPFATIHPASTALRDAYALAQQAAVTYSAIQPIAHRLRDSWAIADAGTTAHLTRKHTQDYVRCAGQILAAIHDVVLDELDASGLVCLCTCPACSLGLCMCAIGSRGILAEAWLAARPPLAEQGVEVQRPRPGSAAAKGGLLKGDLIVALDSQRVDQVPEFMRMLRDHQPGDWIDFTVRRPAGEAKVLVEHRREGADQNEDECIVVQGQDFYLGQARDVRQRLRKRKSATRSGANGLTSLSARELQVLELVGTGATNPLIADELEISRATVANHVSHILEKLGLNNRTEAAAYAAAHRLDKA
jgi:DNA-binding CsgD family transcriptional regulator